MNDKMSSKNGLEKITFKVGDLLFKEGDLSRHFYIIQEGNVEIFQKGLHGEKIPLSVVGAGQSLGEFAMIDDSPRSATARCLTRVEAILVNEEAYKYMIEKLPDWVVSMMQGLVSRIRETNEILKRHGIVDQTVTQKIASTEFEGDVTTAINIDLNDLDDQDHKDE